MPKTFKNLYPSIYDFENLYFAYLKARRSKRYRSEVLEFTSNLEENLLQLQNELIWRTYRTGRYREFYVHDPKTRLVMALPFRDRVVHHALVAVIEPIFERRFIFDSYACRPGKGTHAGANRVTFFLKKLTRLHGRVYCLKADISKYFPSINHRILKELIRKKIVCPGTLWLIDEIIGSAADPSNPDPKGIPIGNLTSQLFANIYLHELDIFVKHTLKARYYVRYMDDFVLLSPNKDELWEYKREIQVFLADRLNLALNGKTSVFPISQGIDFLGYRIWPTHRLLRKNSIKRMKRKLKIFRKKYSEGRITMDRMNASIQSWLGHCKHANTYNLRQKLLGEFTLKRGDPDGHGNAGGPPDPFGAPSRQVGSQPGAPGTKDWPSGTDTGCHNGGSK